MRCDRTTGGIRAEPRRFGFSFDPMGRRFECPTLARKRMAMAEVEEWVSADYRRASQLGATFPSAGLSPQQLQPRGFLAGSRRPAPAPLPPGLLRARPT